MTTDTDRETLFQELYQSWLSHHNTFISLNRLDFTEAMEKKLDVLDAEVDFYHWFDRQKPPEWAISAEENRAWLLTLKESIQQIDFKRRRYNTISSLYTDARIQGQEVRTLGRHYAGSELGCQFSDEVIYYSLMNTIHDDKAASDLESKCSITGLIALRYKVPNGRKEIFGIQLGRLAFREYPCPHADPDAHWFFTGWVLFLEIEEDGRPGHFYLTDYSYGDRLADPNDGEYIHDNAIVKGNALGRNLHLDHGLKGLPPICETPYTLAMVGSDNLDLLDGETGKDFVIRGCSTETLEYGETYFERTGLNERAFFGLYPSTPRRR